MYAAWSAVSTGEKAAGAGCDSSIATWTLNACASIFAFARTAFAAAGAVVVTIGMPVFVVPDWIVVPFAAFALWPSLPVPAQAT